MILRVDSDCSSRRSLMSDFGLVAGDIAIVTLKLMLITCKNLDATFSF